MPAQKMHAWMPDKKKDACKNTKNRTYIVLTPYLRVLTRTYGIDLENIAEVGVHLAVAMGKGFAWATWQNSKNQKNVFAWATWQLQWAKGRGWHVHTRNAQTHSHA